MKIGIDGRLLQMESTGDSTYWRGLIEGLSRLGAELTLYFDSRLPGPPSTINHQPSTIRLLSACCSRVWSAWTFPRVLRDEGMELAHVQYTIPPRMPCPTITTIHDISFRRHPEFFRLKDRLILHSSTRHASKKAARIIVPSQHTRQELIDLYRVEPEKIVVTYEGVDAQFKPTDGSAIQRKYGIDCLYILTLGVIQPRKNLGRLIEAFAVLKGNRGIEHKLVIVGKQGWMAGDLQRRIRKLGLENDVIPTGYIPYEDLPGLYSAADVFVYPSVYEGFGLPPLEAMACGTPVITGNRSSLPEVIGEAGVMVDPYDVEAFTEAMARILTSESLRAEMSARGLIQAAKFSWDKMARETLEVYHQVV